MNVFNQHDWVKPVLGSCQRVKVPWLNIQTRNKISFKESENGDIPEETGNYRYKIKMKVVKLIVSNISWGKQIHVSIIPHKVIKILL